jgi:hypothetical protein
MLNMRIFLLAAASILCAAGCDDVVSLAPLYDDATLVFDAGLVGSWRADKSEIWTFTTDDEKMYRLLVRQTREDEAGARTEEDRFDVGLVRLSGRLFMDLMSDESGPTGAPAHVFARIEIENDVLQVGLLDSEWMKKQLKGQESLTFYTVSKDRVVIAAPSRDLQYFFGRHAWNDEAFLNGTGGPDDPSTLLTRITE